MQALLTKSFSNAQNVKVLGLRLGFKTIELIVITADQETLKGIERLASCGTIADIKVYMEGYKCLKERSAM